MLRSGTFNPNNGIRDALRPDPVRRGRLFIDGPGVSGVSYGVGHFPSERFRVIEITFCVPYESLQYTVDAVFAEHPESPQIVKHVMTMEAKDVPGREFGGDVIIARGISASRIQELDLGIPLIEIPVTGYDIISAVNECKEHWGARHIACIGPASMMYGVSSIEKVMRVELECYLIAREDEGEMLVDKVIRAGVDAVVGGLLVTRAARAKGLPAVMIESGYESIRQVLDEAIRMAHVTREERARVERFRAIMDHSYEGVVAVDEKGRITLFNRTAREINSIGTDACIGSHIDEVLPGIDLTEVLRTGREDLEGLRKLRDSMVTANRVPIRVESRIVGAVATFQRVSRIQEMEGRIRKQIHSKGLTAKYHFRDVIGASRAITECVEMAREFSRVDSNILLIGETGTGKELFAQSIHNESPRRDGPFVAVNCAAIPEHLLESELFGYVEGAFTGASRDGKAGLFELAHNGSIFLDEVSELSTALQSRLLRVLQEKEIMRLGHDRVIPVNVRVISASNRNLKELVRGGQFRQDLLYRLDVLRISIPPLRDRTEDIPLLLHHFLERTDAPMGRRSSSVAPDALELLLRCRWPGNVRELVNICERFSILAKGKRIDAGTVQRVLDMDDEPCDRLQATATGDDPVLPAPCPDPDLGPGSFARSEKEVIRAALVRMRHNRRAAALLLGIDPSTLWRKMKKHDLSF